MKTGAKRTPSLIHMFPPFFLSLARSFSVITFHFESTGTSPSLRSFTFIFFRKRFCSTKRPYLMNTRSESRSMGNRKSCSTNAKGTGVATYRTTASITHATVKTPVTISRLFESLRSSRKNFRRADLFRIPRVME